MNQAMRSAPWEFIQARRRGRIDSSFCRPPAHALFSQFVPCHEVQFPEVPYSLGYVPRQIFNHDSSLISLGDEEGNVYVLHSSPFFKAGEASRELTSMRVHDAAIFDISFATNGDPIMYTGSGDKTVGVTDVEKTMSVSSLKGHTSFVKCVKPRIDNSHILASCGRDGHMMLWDTREGEKPFFTCTSIHPPPNEKPQKRRRTSVHSTWDSS